MNDTALLHCERMDVHVSLGTCGPLTFRQLAKNYLRLDAHPLFEAVDWCVRLGGVLTPTQIGEILLRNRRDADVAMKEVVLTMQARINLGVGGGSRDQLAELDSSCDDQTVKMRLSSDKVADNIYFLDKVATLLKAAKIKTVRIYNTNHSVLKAFSGTSIRRGRLAAR
ncbi:hypothetical protein FF2_015282 [Malus domestica]